MIQHHYAISYFVVQIVFKLRIKETGKAILAVQIKLLQCIIVRGKDVLEDKRKVIYSFADDGSLFRAISIDLGRSKTTVFLALKA